MKRIKQLCIYLREYWSQINTPVQLRDRFPAVIRDNFVEFVAQKEGKEILTVFDEVADCIKDEFFETGRFAGTFVNGVQVQSTNYGTISLSTKGRKLLRDGFTGWLYFWQFTIGEHDKVWNIVVSLLSGALGGAIISGLIWLFTR